MSTTNEKTLRTYEERSREYLERTHNQVSGSLKIWIDRALHFLPPGASILEIGSGNGRDAEYMEKAGYRVLRSDATKAFVQHLQGQGHEVKDINILQDPLPQGFDMIFADAVFLHFTPEELESVLQKVHDALKSGGILAFCVKEGTGSEWLSEKLGALRFFQNWDGPVLAEVVFGAGFEMLYLAIDDSRHPSWILIIAKTPD